MCTHSAWGVTSVVLNTNRLPCQLAGFLCWHFRPDEHTSIPPGAIGLVTRVATAAHAAGRHTQISLALWNFHQYASVVMRLSINNRLCKPAPHNQAPAVASPEELHILRWEEAGQNPALTRNRRSTSSMSRTNPPRELYHYTLSRTHGRPHRLSSVSQRKGCLCRAHASTRSLIPPTIQPPW